MRGGLMTSVLIVVLGSAQPALAQELASSFDQLRVLVRVGDTLTVTDGRGQETRGRLVRLAGTSLDLDVDGITQSLSQDRITTIRQRHPDTLANGAKVGFGVGAGLGLLAGVAVASGFGAPQMIPFMVVIYGAVGTGVGVGVDALQSGHRVVFSRPGPTSARVSVSPIAGQGRRGVRMTVGF